METCGGIGTYLPNYHTMRVSSQQVPKSASPFLKRVSNLTEFITEEFEPPIEYIHSIPPFFRARKGIEHNNAIGREVEPIECHEETISFIFSLEERYKRRLLHRILNVSPLLHLSFKGFIVLFRNML